MTTDKVATDIDQLSINTIRTLSIDAVQQADSGHPGLPMGAAPMTYALWTRIMRHNPRNPHWFNRDRFVLSAGHGSALLYSLLHLTGYDLPLDEIKRFRQWGSKTPGHPEYGLTPGVETTTGPLGQGFGNGVGMAMAEAYLAAHFNRAGHTIVDHYTYGIVSDGDLMEGVASEAASLAGHLKLGKLIYLYDDNKISLDGPTDLAFTEDVLRRFEAYNWQVLLVTDGNDLGAIEQAIMAAQGDTARPSLIAVRTTIGYGSPNKAGSSKAHGSPLGKDEVRLTKEYYGWNPDAQFFVPPEARDHFQTVVQRGEQAEAAWNERLGAYREAEPELAAQLEAAIAGQLPAEWDAGLPTFAPTDGDVATRSASGKALNAIAAVVPTLWGGSADLASSNDTTIKDAKPFQPGEYGGRNIWFGVREHAMGAALNGMGAHGGLKVFGGTFLTFSDYMRGAIRLAALSELPVIYVFTHDSIGLGEDGPTHQPIEHFAALRAIPHLLVIRPGDANEATEAWRVAMQQTKHPTALILSRQKLPVFDQTQLAPASNLAKGAYILAEAPGGTPEVLLLGTGSEVSILLEAQGELAKQQVHARVVSMPCWELFEQQPAEYREQVLPHAVKARLSLEAGVGLGWHRWVGDEGVVMSVERFGASAPYKEIFKHYGLTVQDVTNNVLRLLDKGGTATGGEQVPGTDPPGGEAHS
jgi:transketolase